MLPSCRREEISPRKPTRAEKMVDERPALDHLPDLGSPAPAGTLRGGSGILRDFSDCPFKAYARYRLRARPLPEIRPGLDAAARGEVAHNALHHLWRRARIERGASPARICPPHRSPCRRRGSRPESNPQCGACSSASAPSNRSGSSTSLPRWLDIERQRGPFEVAALEHAKTVKIGPLELQVRLDRIDRLPDGRDVLLDYKTGKCSPGDWDGTTAGPAPASCLRHHPRRRTRGRRLRATGAGRDGIPGSRATDPESCPAPPVHADWAGDGGGVARRARPVSPPAMRRDGRLPTPRNATRPAGFATSIRSAGSGSGNRKQRSKEVPASTMTTDQAQRDRALDPRTSFLVQAPAGSGKTELLIQRYLTLLARVEQPQSVVAITFTKKAAGEMRGRVLDALRSAADSPEPAEPHKRTTWRIAQEVLDHDRRLDWHLLEHPSRLAIQTVDSLCLWLTRRMPLTSGFGSPPGILEDASELYREAARETLALLESAGEYSSALEPVLRHIDNNLLVAEDLLSEMLPQRDQWLRHLSGAGSLEPEAIRAILEGTLRDTIVGRSRERPRGSFPPAFNRSSCAWPSLPALGAAASKRSSECGGFPDCTTDGLAGWLDIANLLLTA